MLLLNNLVCRSGLFDGYINYVGVDLRYIIMRPLSPKRVRCVSKSVVVIHTLQRQSLRRRGLAWVVLPPQPPDDDLIIILPLTVIVAVVAIINPEHVDDSTFQDPPEPTTT